MLPSQIDDDFMMRHLSVLVSQIVTRSMTTSFEDVVEWHINGPYSTNGLINAHPLSGGKMAEFASGDTGTYSIASFYKMPLLSTIYIWIGS